MADYALIVCTNCNETRYRSIRPLEPGTEIQPSMFAPMDENVPEAVEGVALECHECSNPLKVVFEQTLSSKRPPSARKSNVSQLRPLPADIPDVPSGAPMELIFEAADGENILQVAPGAPGWVVVLTNRKIFRIRV